MAFLYSFAILFLRVSYSLASLFNPKAKAFTRGRKNQVAWINSSFPLPAKDRLIWIHCASLGEFEQGRPVLEALKKSDASLKVLLTFFSPSGFEAKQQYAFADYILYLPWDTRHNARWFVEKVNPSLAIFVKYEFWYHYAREIHNRHIPLLSISSIFRADQVFFRPYGTFFASILRNFDHFFVQNASSGELLNGIGITAVTVAGDTRFDRVYELVESTEEVPFARQFKDGQKLMVVGSAWPEDMEVLYPFINENKDRLKFIIAPHEIKESFLSEIEKSIEGKVVRYSAMTEAPGEAQVLLIDNVGMLSRLYRYGEFAFVGGGFNQGLHNILEAACYGIPIFFGNRAYQKYQEASDLILRGGAFEIGGYIDLKANYEMMVNQPQSFLLACEVTRQYVQENLGATRKITDYCHKILN